MLLREIDSDISRISLLRGGFCCCFFLMDICSVFESDTRTLKIHFFVCLCS